MLLWNPIGEITTSESPRDVYINACSEIVAPFVDRGFRFARSGPHATRKAGDFSFRIGFQSSQHNAAGSLVKLWIHGTVLSKRLERWRKTFPQLVAIDYVAGGQIGNLVEHASWDDWNLANSRTRTNVIADAIARIEDVALPYFSQFEDLDSFIVKIQHREIPSMPIDRVVEFLMCFADRAAAQTAARNFLIRNPHFVSNYERDFARYAERGLNYKASSTYAGKLAFASYLFEFDKLTEL